MIRSPRKEREIREREEAILDSACRILLEEGFAALSMDRIASEIEYSRGTIYQHFASKEDILAALTSRTYGWRMALFERAAAFAGRPRERLLAIGVADDLFVRKWPGHFRAEQIILLTAEDEKLGPDRAASIEAQEKHCFETVTSIVQEGIAGGDLVLPGDCSAEQVTFGLWSLSFGAHFIGATLGRYSPEAFGGSLFECIGFNVNCMLDGMNFKPLTADQDWHAVEQRVRREVFAEEFRALGLLD